MVDDDTYIIQPSLAALLGHLDSTKPYYLGNKLGGWNERFGHGGSSLILSRAAMRLLFDEHPEYVAQSHAYSLREELGDRLVALTLMKVGVYLEEDYTYFFNGETPVTTKVTSDRLCYPLLGFHWLNDQERMTSVAKKFRGVKEVVFWHQLWGIYGHPAFDTLADNPIRKGQDHVGREDDERKTIPGITSPERCLKACLSRSDKCMAWTWDEGKICRTATYFILGNAPENKQSGLNIPRILEQLKKCKIK